MNGGADGLRAYRIDLTEPPPRRTEWGPWRLLLGTLELEHVEQRYHVDLERCGSATAVLDLDPPNPGEAVGRRRHRGGPRPGAE
jgi:hypothetical protein